MANSTILLFVSKVIAPGCSSIYEIFNSQATGLCRVFYDYDYTENTVKSLISYINNY